mmetsp:Transcript_2830/g.7096  ORF Transcript_2830/g.7096 Transcript_2830/m.7096 type:complete len:210 (-) Transcript_2830:2786-3415(-)
MHAAVSWSQSQRQLWTRLQNRATACAARAPLSLAALLARRAPPPQAPRLPPLRSPPHLTPRLARPPAPPRQTLLYSCSSSSQTTYPPPASLPNQHRGQSPRWKAPPPGWRAVAGAHEAVRARRLPRRHTRRPSGLAALRGGGSGRRRARVPPSPVARMPPSAARGQRGGWKRTTPSRPPRRKYRGAAFCSPPSPHRRAPPPPPRLLPHF